jgi:hypothetical protein
VLIELPFTNAHCDAAQIILNHDLEGMKVVLPKATRNFYVGMHNAAIIRMRIVFFFARLYMLFQSMVGSFIFDIRCSS